MCGYADGAFQETWIVVSVGVVEKFVTEPGAAWTAAAPAYLFRRKYVPRPSLVRVYASPEWIVKVLEPSSNWPSPFEMSTTKSNAPAFLIVQVALGIALLAAGRYAWYV